MGREWGEDGGMTSYRLVWIACAIVLPGVTAALVMSASRSVDVGEVVRPEAVLQTDPVPHGGDSADDPAIWIHPTDEAKSLILGTDKNGALHVYDNEGRQIQAISPTCKPNNVDVIYAFALGEAKVDLALASTRGRGETGVKVWAIDAQTRRLRDVTAGPGAAIPVFDGQTPYGICTYRSARTGKHFFFVSDKLGRIEQYRLVASGDRVGAIRARQFNVSSTVEGMVADEEWGAVYFSEEAKGVWKVGAEPDCKDAPALAARVGENGLRADAEGVAIYYGRDGDGYLIASSQGSNTFKVYQRKSPHAFVCTIDPKKGAIDDVNDTDGISVTNRSLGGKLERGAFIVQDGHNDGGNQNFKIYRWEDIAGSKLLIDPAHDPRKIAPMEPGTR